MPPSALDSRILYWICADESNLVAAVVKQSLDTWQAHRGTHHQRVVAEHLNDWGQLGLSVWTVTTQVKLPAVCTALESQRRNYPQAFQLVYLESELANSSGVLIEAGANYVVQQICQLQTVLLKVVDGLKVSNEGHNPLTSGLLTRLPWS